MIITLVPAELPERRLAESGPEPHEFPIGPCCCCPPPPPPPPPFSSKSHFEFFLDRVSSFWCFGGSGFSFPSGGSLFSIVARISSERRFPLARPCSLSSSSSPRESSDLSVDLEIVFDACMCPLLAPGGRKKSSARLCTLRASSMKLAATLP